MELLGKEFYDRSPLLVAPELLGKLLISEGPRGRISGRIVETEAYLAEEDPASHAYKGRTRRNASLYLGPGHAYIYSIHTHLCLDLVTEGPGIPTSVLIRALEPIDGIEIMKDLRGRDSFRELTSGPGKLTQALAVEKKWDGTSITSPDSPLKVYSDGWESKEILRSGRIGISAAKELQYRFYIPESCCLSR